MARKIGFGLLWFVVLYFVGCFALGAVAGGIAGASDPEHAREVGRAAGSQIVAAWRLYIAIGAAAVSALGVAKGILPGTRARDTRQSGA